MCVEKTKNPSKLKSRAKPVKKGTVQIFLSKGGA